MIVNDIKSKIDNGMLIKNEQLSPELTLTKEYNVSRVTIQRAFDILIRDGYIVRRQGQGTFVAASRPNLPVNRRFISLVLTDSNKLFIRMIERIEKILSENDFYVTLHITNNNVEYEKNICQKMIEDGASGIIIFPINDTSHSDFYTKLVMTGFPIVFLDKCPADVPCNFITANGFTCMYELTNCAIKNGHTHFAFFARRDCNTIRQRLKGIQAAIQNNELTLRKEYVCIQDDGIPFFDKLIREMPRPFVLLCGNDDEAIYSIQYLRSKGLRVPEDISVTGFDNTKIAEEKYSLTTVRQDFEKQGETAARIILERILHGNEDMHTIYVDGTLIKRASLLSPV